jgi:hypothetical protein
MKTGHEKPIDAVAARVVSRGEHFEYQADQSSLDSDLPLAVKPIPRAAQANPSFKNHTGERFGRFTVVGLSADRKSRWVCRCVCGRYSMRSSQAISSAAKDACCDQCYLQAVSKRHEHLRRSSKDRPTNDFLS